MARKILDIPFQRYFSYFHFIDPFIAKIIFHRIKHQNSRNKVKGLHVTFDPRTKETNYWKWKEE